MSENCECGKNHPDDVPDYIEPHEIAGLDIRVELVNRDPLGNDLLTPAILLNGHLRLSRYMLEHFIKCIDRGHLDSPIERWAPLYQQNFNA